RLRQLADDVGGRRGVGADQGYGVHAVRDESAVKLAGLKIGQSAAPLLTHDVRYRHLRRLMWCRVTAARVRPVLRSLTRRAGWAGSRAGPRSSDHHARRDEAREQEG